MGIKGEDGRRVLIKVLDKLRDDELLLETSIGRYKINNRGLILEGRFERRSNGKNFFVPDDDANIIYIPERNSKHAMNGDRVRVQLLAKRKRAETEGTVVEILEHTQSRFVGVLEVQKHFAFLVMDNKYLANDIFIPKEDLHGAVNGDKAVVEIVEWPEKANNPVGKVIDILGKPGDNNTEMHAIPAQYDLPYKYPEEAEKYASKISDKIDEQRLQREKTSECFTITIDPKDAKDLMMLFHSETLTHYMEVGSYCRCDTLCEAGRFGG